MNRILVMAALAFLVGCSGGGTSTPAPVPIPAISVSPKPVFLPVNGLIQMTSTVPGTGWTVEGWQSWGTMTGPVVTMVDLLNGIPVRGVVLSTGMTVGATARIIGTHPTDSRATDSSDVTIVGRVSMEHGDVNALGPVRFWVSGVPVAGTNPTYTWIASDAPVLGGGGPMEDSMTVNLRTGGRPVVYLKIDFDNGIQPMVFQYSFFP